MYRKSWQTKRTTEFILTIFSVFEGFQYKGKKYLSYISAPKSGDEFLIRDNIIKPLFADALGYDKQKDFVPEERIETGQPDLQVLDASNRPFIVIETLASSAPKSEFDEHRVRLFSYAKELKSRYAVLTNGINFEVYRCIDRRVMVSLKFDAVYRRFINSGIEVLTPRQLEGLSKVAFFKKERWLYRPEEIYKEPELDIAQATHFSNFIEELKEKMGLVIEDVVEQFEYLNTGKENVRKSDYKHAKRFEESLDKWGKIWKTDSSFETFQLETMYIFFNRILLLRICEDKQVIPKRIISNGGIKDWLGFRGWTDMMQIKYDELLKLAYHTMESIYPHLFREDIFDWYVPNNEVLRKILFAFNFYNFKNVDKDILGRLYQEYISPEERKKLGQFYTPEPIIDYILDKVGYNIGSDIEGKRLLDPACGSGGFLVRATSILVTRLKKRGFDAETILNKVRENIYGFEINPFACHLAETNLLFQVIDLIKETKESNSNFEFERFNIFQTDTLRIPEGWEAPLFEEYNSYWLEDAEIVKKIKLKKNKFMEGFDFVVGNPPYVTVWGIDAKTKDYFRTYYKSAKGRFNTFTIFIERGIQFLGSNKYLGYVVPQGLLTHNEYQYIRDYILKKCAVDNIHLLPSGIFESAVDTLVIIIHTEDKEEMRVSNEVTVSIYEGDRYKVIQSAFVKNPLKQFHIFITSDIETIFNKMGEGSIPLDELVEIQQGIIYTGIPKSKIFSNEPKTPQFKAVLDGRDIGRYKLRWDMKQENKFIQYSRKLHRPREERLFLAPEKLLMPRKTTQIFATYDNKQFYALNTAYIIIPKSKRCLIKYILALLNSKLFSWFYQKKWIGWQVVIPALKELPIKVAPLDIQENFVRLVAEIMTINEILPDYENKVSNIELLLREFDFAVGDLADIPGVKIEFKRHIGKPKISIDGLKVSVDSKSFIECENDYLAHYIGLYLLSKVDELRGKTKTDIVALVQTPKSLNNVKDVLKKREEIIRKIENLKRKQSDSDKTIDKNVYEIYNLTTDEIEHIEQKSEKLAK